MKTRALLALGVGSLALLLFAASLPAQQATPQKAPPKSDSSVAQSVLTNQDVILLVKAKFSDALIIAKIKQSETKFDTSVRALIALREAGVSESVIALMLDPHEALKDQEDAMHPPRPPTKKGTANIASSNLSGGTGELAGQVFFITEGQGVKPSRSARVGLFGSAQADLEPMIRDLSKDAAAIADERSDSGDEGQFESQLVERDCMSVLTVFGRQLHTENFSAQTDDSGNFTLAGLKPDKLKIIVFGRVEPYAAIWIADADVQNGKKTELKIHEPAIACFDPDSLATF